MGSYLDFIRPIYREPTFPGKTEYMKRQRRDEAVWGLRITTHYLIRLKREGVVGLSIAQKELGCPVVTTTATTASGIKTTATKELLLTATTSFIECTLDEAL